MPDTVVDLVGQGDGVRPWGGRWPPYWDSASSDLGSEGTRGLCISRAERLRPTDHSSPGKDRSLCCPTPQASGGGPGLQVTGHACGHQAPCQATCS